MKWIYLLLLVASTCPGSLQKRTIDLSHSENNVEFLAVGSPSAMKIRGKLREDLLPSGNLTGKLVFVGDELSGTAKLSLQFLVTGIELRDQHMRSKYLELEKYPEAELTFPPQSLPQGEGLPFRGVLTLHGNKKPITGTASIKRSDERAKLKFIFAISLSDFGVETPSYLGISVVEAVRLSVETDAPISR